MLIPSEWVHAKTPCANLWLRGYELSVSGEHSALLDDKPRAFTRDFVETVESLTGCKFNCFPLDQETQLRLEYEHVCRVYARLEAKNYWTPEERRFYLDLSKRHSALWKAVKELDNA
jgi:hypothetical protein